jgi:hypothetical protein
VRSVTEPAIALVKSDHLGAWLVTASRRTAASAVGLVTPDRIDRYWVRGALALATASSLVRGAQTGRARDYAIALTMGAASLLILALVSAWR